MPTDLLARLSRLDIELWVEGENLRFSAPEGSMTPELAQEIRALKPQILKLLRSGESGFVSTDRTGAIPLSPEQEGMWLAQRLAPESAAYNSGHMVEICGPVTRDGLQFALDQLVARHEILRTTYEEVNGEGVQRVQPPKAVSLEFLKSIDETEAQRLSDAFMAEPCGLSDDPQVRALWTGLEPGRGRLTLAIHHIGFDGGSGATVTAELLQDLTAFHKGESSQVAPPVFHYGDYAAWSRDPKQVAEREVLLERWTKRMAGAPAETALPFDRPPTGKSDTRGDSRFLTLSGTPVAALRRIAKEERATPFMVVLAAWVSFLHQITGQRDLVVGTPLSTRPSHMEGAVGFFVNALPLRFPLAGTEWFTDLVNLARRVTLEGVQEVSVDLSALARVIRLDGGTSRSPLFNVLFALDEARQGSSTRDELFSHRPFLVGAETAQYDLSLSCMLESDELTLEINYLLDVFDSETIDRFLEEFAEQLRVISTGEAAENAVSAYFDERQRKLIEETNDTYHIVNGPATLHGGFEAQADLSPDGIALEQGATALSYRELDSWANQIANTLAERGTQREDIVAVVLPREPRMVAALLGVLKAGASYLPIDPEYPESRLRLILDDADPSAIITSREVADSRLSKDTRTLVLEADSDAGWSQSTVRPSVTVAPEDRAYVIYTSGSTGTPKGVEVEHHSAAHFIEFAEDLFGLEPGKRMLQFISVSFDPSVHEIFTPLRAGSTVVLRDDSMLASTEAFLGAVDEAGIDVVSLPTAFWHQVAGDLGPDTQLPTKAKTWIIGGEQVSSTRLEKWHSKPGERRLINLYGPTECSIASTWHVLDTTRGPIGRPIWNTRCHVLDPSGQSVPIGMEGELFIAGAGVARGYLNDPQKTKDRFSSEPGPLGDRMYRTGDKVRRLKDGTLEYRGRLDDQVKIRGYRIELGEVEAALRRHPFVNDAVAKATKDAETETLRLEAFVVFSIDAETSPSDLRRDLAASYPDHLIPSVVVPIESIPLTTHGKVDRDALKSPEQEVVKDQESPIGPVEQAVASVWKDVLGISEVGRDDQFFHLGGHSLLAMRAASRLSELLGADVSAIDLFEHPTVQGLAAHIGVPAGVVLDQLEATVAGTDLAFQQEGMWYLWKLAPESPAFNMSFAIRIQEDFDSDALAKAVSELTSRHDSLRAKFPVVEGKPTMEVRDDLEVPLEVIDVDAPDPGTRAAALREEVAAFLDRPFDLEEGPVVRVGLVRAASDDVVIAFSIHHIVSDATSMGILISDLGTLYREAAQGAATSSLPSVKADYRRFVDRQQGEREKILGEGVPYWSSLVEGVPTTPFTVPTDLRPPVQSLDGGAVYLELDRDTADRLESIGESAEATKFMTYLGLFGAYLNLRFGRPDVLVGYPSDGRSRAEEEQVVGYFVNPIVHRANLSPTHTFEGTLKGTRAQAIAGMRHRLVPMEEVVKAVSPVRNPSFHSLFQVMFTFQERLAGEFEFGGMPSEPFTPERNASQFDMTLNIVPGHEGGVGLRLDYASDLLSETDALAHLEGITTLARAICESPETPLVGYDVRADADRRQLEEWNRTDRPVEHPQTLHGGFSRSVSQYPDHPALELGDRIFTYAELDRWSNQIGRHLQNLGLRPNDVVGVALARTPELIATLLAVLKVGAAYVPLDPTYPASRLHGMLNDARPRFVISSTESLSAVSGSPATMIVLDQVANEIAECSDSGLDEQVRPSDRAYVIYTSGSTGKPKGVEVEHESVCHFIAFAEETFGLKPGSRMLQFISPSFDPSVHEIFTPLWSGATLVLRDDEMIATPQLFAEAVDRLALDVVSVPTAYWTQLARELQKGLKLPEGVKTWIMGGEQAPSDALEAWSKAGGPRLLNLYGPTECSIACTWFEVSGSQAPIGTPIWNTRAHVLDPFGREASIGVEGELAIAGAGVTRGYLNDPWATADVFVPEIGNPANRMYRTGDRVRWNRRGYLEFLGRVDDQVKVRGFRVELGDVEAALVSLPEVAQAAATVDRGATGDRLLAYVVLHSGLGGAVSQVRRDLKDVLPPHMIPSKVVALDALPMTPNGKVDRKALAQHDALDPGSSQEAQELTGTEQGLARIWQEVIGSPVTSPEDNFFDLGGHSLQTVEVLFRIEQETGAKLSPGALMMQTLGQLADELDAASEEPAGTT